jgi:hypothetical protein
MVKDPKPLPMLMSRRRSAATRFAHLIQAYNDAPSVTAFGRATEPNTYRITRTDGEDLLFADTDSLKFWMVRSAQGNPSRLSAFNVADVRSGAVLLLESPVPVERIECRWSHDTLAVESPGPLGQTSILAPEAKVVMLNGSFAEFTRSGQRITLRKAGTAYQISTTSNDTLFLGLKNVLTVRANLPESDHSSFSTPAKITMAEDTRERIASQLSWWGGIVNLKAFNKGPVTRIIAPGTYENDFAWLTSAQEREEAGGLTQKITVRVPNDAPPVDIKTTFVLGQTTVNKTFTPSDGDLSPERGIAGHFGQGAQCHAESSQRQSRRCSSQSLESRRPVEICRPIQGERREDFFYPCRTDGIQPGQPALPRARASLRRPVLCRARAGHLRRRSTSRGNIPPA